MLMVFNSGSGVLESPPPTYGRQVEDWLMPSNVVLYIFTIKTISTTYICNIHLRKLATPPDTILKSSLNQRSRVMQFVYGNRAFS